ncbi:MAG: NAD-dependent protein deacylase [Kineosporiaceae bacterium]|nr:NAD-dependent protein deacylase [Kineosporiaceae bacterium]MBK7624754.1 NAD-dependent protein deacylase [Kineosporiaceae bacterium]
MTLSVPETLLSLARRARRVTVLTGAGMSAESGVPTFRDAQQGLWSRFDPTELATPQAWHRDPALVNAWYLWRVALVRRAEPHAGHRALAAWARRAEVELRIVTQNVDDLHERAGSPVLAHLHGSLFAWRCDRCGEPAEIPSTPLSGDGEPLDHVAPTGCPLCPGRRRPGVVWFGEALPSKAFQMAQAACRATDLVLVIGTSGLVHPAATLPHLATAAGIPVVEIDPHATALGAAADHTWHATAGEALPLLVAALDAD